MLSALYILPEPVDFLAFVAVDEFGGIWPDWLTAFAVL
jgi:hypothetical protein